MKSKVIIGTKKCSYIRNPFLPKPPMVDVEIVHNDFSRPSSTDVSYYVPSSEINKNLSKLGPNNGCLYDNGNVSDVVADMRRPGNDIVDYDLMATGIVKDCMAEVDFNKRAKEKQAQEYAKNMVDTQKRNDFVTNLMTNTSKE